MRRLLIACIVGVFLCGLALTPVVSAATWPGQVLLWPGTVVVTQTVQYQSVDVVGNDFVYVFYDLGYGSAGASTTNITVTRQWRGVVFETITATAVVSTTQTGTGAITVASASPYYPQVQVAIKASLGTITPTIGVVGQ